MRVYIVNLARLIDIMEYALEANQIFKILRRLYSTNDVTIKVPKGSIYGLLGPNGAGKTSLIRIINQITLPRSGHDVY